MTPAKEKFFLVLAPAAKIDNASGSTNVIDTKGFGFLRVFVLIGDLDIAATALKLQEADAASDATTLTSGADITGTRFGTDANDTGSTSTLPSATDDNKAYCFEVDLKGRKRYIKPVFTGGDGSTGAYVTIFALLSRGDNVPTKATEKNIAQVMRLPAF